MPIYYGWKAHREHGVPFRASRSGSAMQADPRHALRWTRFKQEAEGCAELRRLLDGLQERGFGPRQITDTLDGLLKDEVARIRKRYEENGRQS